jgi:hypothetical protein
MACEFMASGKACHFMNATAFQVFACIAVIWRWPWGWPGAAGLQNGARCRSVRRRNLSQRDLSGCRDPSGGYEKSGDPSS